MNLYIFYGIPCNKDKKTKKQNQKNYLIFSVLIDWKIKEDIFLLIIGTRACSIGNFCFVLTSNIGNSVTNLSSCQFEKVSIKLFRVKSLASPSKISLI